MLDAGRVAHAAVPTLRFDVRVERRGGEAIRSVVLDNADPDRRAPARLRRGERDAAATSCSATPERWGTTLRTLLWTRVTQVVPAFTGETVVELRVPCTYDFEVAASRYLDALARRRRAARAPVQRHGVLRRRRTGAADDPDRLGPRGRRTGCPSRCGARRWTRHFPGTAWLRLRRDTFDRLHAYKARARADELGGRARRAARAGRRERWTASARIADAVLYEGYMLWPYRRSALKNQRRWTFGGVYPEAHSRGAPGDDPCAMRTEVPARGRGGERRGRACASCTSCSAARSTRGGEPVDELEVDGERHLTWEEAVEREIVVPTLRDRRGRRDRRRDGAGASARPLGDAGALVRALARARRASMRVEVAASSSPAGCAG